MSQTSDFYDARAQEAASEASKSELENVRQRHLRAEATWRALADQARGVVESRAKALREREARRSAEEAAERSFDS